MASVSKPPVDVRPDVIIGVGGIGSGIFFELAGDHTLGRDESRAATLLDRADYCKLHIIFHYLSVLLKRGTKRDRPRLIPVGRVGDDADGRRLIGMMNAAGIDTSNVLAVPGRRTLFSACFQYPDGSGGNITSSNDAGSTLAPEDIAALEPLVKGYGRRRGMVVAAPEVPLPARAALLELGTARQWFRAASFISGEIQPAIARDLFRIIDLVGLNRDEAAAVAGIAPDKLGSDDLVLRCADKLWGINSDITISITLGAEGSALGCGGRFELSPAFPSPDGIASTAGSGDAHLAGSLAGLIWGLPLMGSEEKRGPYVESPAATAHDLANLTASMAAASGDTINTDINPETLADYAARAGVGLSAKLAGLLQPGVRGQTPGTTVDGPPRQL